MIATFTPAGPALPQLQKEFADLAATLTSADTTLTSMVEGHNPVGAGWGPYLGGVAKRFQAARDTFLDAKPAETELGAKLGADVIKLAEAAGSLGVMARQRATLSAGWATFLDSAIADAIAAAALVAPGDSTPPAPPAPPATTPADSTLPAEVAGSVGRAIGFINQSISRIRTVPVSDRGDASTKDARIAAYELNMQAQKALEPHFGGGDATLTSELRRADAYLEDANWQLAKKPSPDGRFNGVDIPGALRDSQAAVDALTRLVNPGGTEVEPVEAMRSTTHAPASSIGAGGLPVTQPGDIDYCQTPGFPH